MEFLFKACDIQSACDVFVYNLTGGATISFKSDIRNTMGELIDELCSKMHINPSLLNWCKCEKNKIILAYYPKGQVNDVIPWCTINYNSTMYEYGIDSGNVNIDVIKC
jgi:hypothetical protein